MLTVEQAAGGTGGAISAQAPNEARAAGGSATPWSDSRYAFLTRAWTTCVAVYIGSWLGYALIYPSSYISIFWLPNTILLVALLLSPLRQWFWLLLVAFPVHLLAQAQLGTGFERASLYYLFDCALVLLTAGALRRAGLGSLYLDTLRKTLLFIAVTTVATAAAALIWSPLIVSLVVGGDPWEAWSLAFASNLLPFLTAAPGLAIGLPRARRMVRSASLAQYTEFSLLALGLLACGFGVFAVAPQVIASVPALFYAPIPFLLWAAVRFGPRGLSFAFLIYALLATFGVVAGHGLFVTPSAADSVNRLQLFLLALYVPMLVLASVVAEWRVKEKALRESEARYRAVVEDQTELICRFRQDGTFTFVNRVYCDYFGHSAEELIGRSFWFLIPQVEHTGAREFLDALTPENPTAIFEHQVLLPDGGLRWIRWSDRAFFDERGRVVEIQAVGRDITERKHTEDAMAGLAHGARLALVGELIGSIAHEINQPLGAILNNAKAAELLLGSESPPIEELRSILADIRSDDLRASEVIRHVRTLLRKREIQLAPLDINEVVAEVAALIQSDAERRRVVVSTELGSGLPAVVGDGVYLQQVLLNLIINGMEAMNDTPPSDRRIFVRSEQNGDASVHVSVSDAGHGIPTEHLFDVFNSFYTTKEHGMGLGLAIARSIIELHDGNIWASNNKGGGATVHFSVPTAPEVRA